MRLGKRNKVVVEGFLFVILLTVVVHFGFSHAEMIEDDSRVAENSELTYYIDVVYDGKDQNVQVSSDTAIAQVHSGFIDVEDTIPAGLTFDRFVESEDGTIGAVKRSNEKETCSGLVVGGMEGLHYNQDTRTISFRVQNLQAGCKLTVGLVTKTPRLGENKRLDFYNTAYGREKEDNTFSNTVHVFMGQEDEKLYSVEYQYDGAVLPDNLPSLPPLSNYPAGVKVGVSGDVNVDGYIFEGWTSDDVVIGEDKTFTMPESNVVLKGKFSRKAVYEVEYQLEESGPSSYTLPETKSYGEGDQVVVDDLKAGDIVDGYLFKGWKVEQENVTLEKGEEQTFFTMPGEKVVLKGSFEQIKYTVSYQYQGTVPDGAAELLPQEEKHAPGEEVTVKLAPSLSGYTFSGWYQTDTFEMPEHDVVIYGEWSKILGKFQPTITKQVMDKKASYQKGEKVKFQITVTNPSAYAIQDVLLEETLAGSKFLAGSNYEVLSDQYVRIPNIGASENVVVQAEYTVGDEVAHNYVNEVILSSATGVNGDLLDDSQEYKATDDFLVSNVSLEIHKINSEKDPLNGAEFTLYRNEKLDDVFGVGLVFTGLAINQTYYLKETKVPTGYVALAKPLTVQVDGEGNVEISGYDVKNTNGKAEVDIVNQKINILPNTGGMGIVPYIIIGIVLILVAAIGMIVVHTKEGRKK